jgi:hypothetical protein
MLAEVMSYVRLTLAALGLGFFCFCLGYAAARR